MLFKERLRIRVHASATLVIGLIIIAVGAAAQFMGLFHMRLRGRVKEANLVVQNSVPVFLQFFDWFHEESWKEDQFVDPPNWSALGIHGSDRSSEDFYYKQFAYIKSLGVDALAWEYNARMGVPPSYPSAAAIRALRRSGLQIVPFLDLEISFKVLHYSGDPLIATLSTTNDIHPNDGTVGYMTELLKQFFDHVPDDLLAHDKKGRQVIYVFGYGFDDADPNPAAWSNFGEGLVQSISSLVSSVPAFYWTTKNSPFEEYLFLHYRTNFVPFHFVLDTPQSQYGHDSVTWNFGFDNLGVQRTSGLERVIRLDPRYVEEMGWLAKAADPAAVFIYGWNEPFEGTMLIPTKQWGDTKARLAKEMIHRLKYGDDPRLPKTLLIVDDLSAYWNVRGGDWHLDIEEQLLLYPMRRFAPQADVRMVSEITPVLLDQYADIIDISSGKTRQVSSWLLQRMDTHRIMVFDPLAGYTKDGLATYFATLGQSPEVNGNVALSNGSGAMFVRDDVNEAQPYAFCAVKLSAMLPAGPQSTRTVPLVVTRGNAVWVNAYTTDERVLMPAFEALYGKPMNVSILYGEALASQRLEIDAKTGKVTENRLTRYSVDGHWDIPKDVAWDVMPPDVPIQCFRFLFGLDG